MLIKPRFKAMADEFTDIMFAKVNVDVNEKVSSQAGVTAMPTFQFYKNLKKVKELKGANEMAIRKLINEFK
jgi:thioredoxin 1